MLEQAQRNFTPRKARRPTKQAAGKQEQDRQQHQKNRARVRRARRNVKSPTREYNFVDPDSRLTMDTGRNAFAQAYNARVAVDGQAQVIVAAEITQCTNDREQLVPMVQATCAVTGAIPQTITADVGYWDSLGLRDPSLRAINVLASPDSKPQPPDAVLPPQVPHTEEAKRMRERLANETQKKLYAQRKVIVEPVFGQIKEIRGFRCFRFRGLKRVAAEWKLICATQNLLKVFRHRMNSLGVLPPAIA